MLRIELLESAGKTCLEDVPVSTLEVKTILISGASGIVGTHLLYALRHIQHVTKVGVKVVALVHRSVPEHLLPLSGGGGGMTFLAGDLSDDAFVSALPEADLIVHAATYGQPGLFMEHPEVTIKLNTQVTLAMFERLLRAGGRFLFVSSSELYSGLTDAPFTERQIGTTGPDHPRACYIEAKRCGEAIVNVFRGKGVAASSARLSLAYGPGTRAGDRRVLNNFIEKALLKKEISLMDAGAASRTYCYVTDAVNMMWHILLSGNEPVYNVGGTSTVTIAGLARLIGELTGVRVVVPAAGKGGPSGAPEDVRLDLSRYAAEFGEKKFVPMGDGLQRTIEWQRSLYAS
jgi:nucleoside-diphosphate-sugar epimerase